MQIYSSTCYLIPWKAEAPANSNVDVEAWDNDREATLSAQLMLQALGRWSSNDIHLTLVDTWVKTTENTIIVPGWRQQETITTSSKTPNSNKKTMRGVRCGRALICREVFRNKGASGLMLQSIFGAQPQYYMTPFGAWSHLPTGPKK